MDKWKDVELEKMKVGGNKKAKDFFKSQSDYKENMPLKDKYNTRAAALYRDKISTEASGKSWSIETSSARNYQPGLISSSANSNSSSSLSYNNSNSNFNNFESGGYQSSSFNTAEFKSQTNDFFARKQLENANRPDDLPPSQGGRYGGFGNTVEKPPADNDLMSSLSSGFSSLTSNASKWAFFAKDNVVKIGSKAVEKAGELSKTVNDKVKEGTLLTSVQSGVTNVGSSVGNMTTNAWSNINSYWGGKTGYDSVPGSNSTQSLSQQEYRRSSNSNMNASNSSNNNNNGTNANASSDWNNWDNDGWSEVQPKEKNSGSKTTAGNKKSNLIDFDDSEKWATQNDDDFSNWEPIDQSNKSKNKNK